MVLSHSGVAIAPEFNFLVIVVVVVVEAHEAFSIRMHN